MVMEYLDTRAIVDRFSNIKLGDPLTFRALAILPVYHAKSYPEVEYSTLARGISSGKVFVVESTDLTVPTLRVLNSAPFPSLMLGGEEVVGGYQNRFVNTTILVAAASMMDLPVSCVEQGRWHELSGAFDLGELAYPSLRRINSAHVATSFESNGNAEGDQNTIWEEISGRQAREGTQSATGALHASYEQRSTELSAVEAALPYPPGQPIGAVALIGSRSHCADIFDSAKTCQEYWPRLVRSYFLDAVESPLEHPSIGSAQRLLQRARASRHVAFKSPGLGFDIRLSGNGIVGSALALGETVVHAAVFRIH
jgi:hypothetical protein